MESKKINQLATEMAPASTDLTIIGDPITGVSKKVTLLQIADIFSTIGTVTSVGVTETGDALTITGSPITSSGTINIGFAGAASQYVRGDGALADFPTSAGGGSSVSYYLNSSVSQGTIGGVAYRELSKEPVIGAGTDITISANGYIASYITDANDPALLEVPGGNFNCEFYFSVNSNAHNPYVYAELYKYDGTTFTLLGSSQSVPEYLTNGTTLSPYYFAIPVATSALTITDRLAIRIYANVDTRTVTLHTENSHLCQVVTTFSKGLTSLNNLTAQVQYLATGTSGTDFAISSSTATHTFNLPVASATNTGKLSSTDWSTFNNKQSAIGYTPANDSLVVHLAGSETITGLKTFNTPIVLDNALNLKFDASINAFGGYYSLYAIKGVSSGNSILALYDGDTNKKSSLTFDNANNFNYLFPSTSGTVALTSDLTGGTVTSAALSAPTGFSVTGSPVTTTGTLALSFAAGYSLPTNASQTNWDSAYTNRITSLTTTGNSGSATLVSNTLNVPTYTLAGLGGISLTSLSATTPLSYNNTTGAFSIQFANTSQDGYLSSTDWNTFNGKQNTITNPVTGTGTSGQVTYFNGTSSVTGSSSFKFDGTNLTIGNPSSALAQLHVYNASAAASFLLQTNSTTDYSEIAVRNNSSTATSYFRQYSTATTSSDFGVSRAGLAMFFSNYATNFVVGTRNGGNLILGTDDQARVWINSSNGYVGIGSGFTSTNPAYNLDVNGTGRFTGALTGTSATFSGQIAIGGQSNIYGGLAGLYALQNGNSSYYSYDQESGIVGNGYYDGGWKYKTTNRATRYIANIGTHTFEYAASGTANAALTWLPALTIANTGAATFSSSVSAATESQFTGTSVNSRILITASGVANTVIGFNNSGATTTGVINNAAYVGVLQAYPLIFTTDSTARLTLASTGAATFSSSVTANRYIINGTNGNSGQIIQQGDLLGSAATNLLFQSSTGNSIGFLTNGGTTFNMFINTSGNVGISTSSPSTKLQVEDGYISTYHNINVDGAGYGLQFYTNGGGSKNTIATIDVSQVGTARSGTLIFNTSNAGAPTERMRITSGGEVLIGASAGSGNNESVYIVSNSTQSFRLNNTHNTSGDVNFVSLMGTNTFNTSSVHYIAYSAGSQAISIYGNGNIQNANNSYGALSDIKLKENIVDASPKLNDLLKVKIRNYNLIGNETKQIGVVAQELEEIFPSMIEEDKDGIKGVKYSVFVPMLIKALQEQQKQIEELKAKIK